MAMQRIINVSIPLCHTSIIFNEVECLAFTLMVKHRFVNSTINNPSIRNLKQMFHIGQNKLTRILKTGIERNYISYDSYGRLIAMPVYDSPTTEKGKTQFYYHIRMTDDLLNSLGSEKDCLNIKTFERFIRQAVLTNKIKIATRIGFDFRLSQLHPKGNKAAHLKRKCHTSEAKKNLSLSRISKVLKCGKYSARKIINSLVNSKIVIRSFQNIDTGIRCSENRKDITLWYNQNYERGFYFAHEGKVYLHLSNIYDYDFINNPDVIKIKTAKR